jgi:hypothetical protein
MGLTQHGIIAAGLNTCLAFATKHSLFIPFFVPSFTFQATMGLTQHGINAAGLNTCLAFLTQLTLPKTHSFFLSSFPDLLFRRQWA